MEPLEERRLLSAMTWTGTLSTSWDDPGNWA
jgi:hypothetical protein